LAAISRNTGGPFGMGWWLSTVLWIPRPSRGGVPASVSVANGPAAGCDFGAGYLRAAGRFHGNYVSHFQIVGTPVSRHGFLLSVPGVTIEVAKECSSIRSSIALFITCLLAAHLYIRTGWKKFVVVVLALLLSVVKNGIRIATLTLLSIYVNPGFLTGKLHHEGGFLFFLIALLILLPVFLWMEKSDKARISANSAR